VFQLKHDNIRAKNQQFEQEENMFTAIIPVRKGSIRLTNKNIMPFAGENLLTYKIKQLQSVPEIDSIVVSSDSNEMLEMARELRVNTHKRADEYCDERTRPFGAVVAHICENVRGDDIIWATCTSPLVEPSDYIRAIKIYKKIILTKHDSLVSFEALKRFVWNEEGPINYVPDQGHVSSQDLPALFVKTCGISIAPRRDMIRWKYDHGANPYRFILNKRAAIDIDDVYDLVCAKAWLTPPLCESGEWLKRFYWLSFFSKRKTAA
jgi:N-acylneuraminate cytidylyltransferase